MHSHSVRKKKGEWAYSNTPSPSMTQPGSAHSSSTMDGSSTKMPFAAIELII